MFRKSDYIHLYLEARGTSTTAYNWAYNSTYSLSDWPYMGEPKYLLTPMSLKEGFKTAELWILILWDLRGCASANLHALRMEECEPPSLIQATTMYIPHTYVRIHMRIYVFMYVYSFVYLSVCSITYTSLYICTHAQMYFFECVGNGPIRQLYWAPPYIYIYVCIYRYTNIDTSLPVYKHACICALVLRVYILPGLNSYGFKPLLVST